MLTAEYLINKLDLKPLPQEGGFYRETYRCAEIISSQALPNRYGGARPFGTAIYYLLTPETCSALHCLRSDEIFHFYLGDPVKMLKLYPDGSAEVLILGQELDRGQQLQAVVPRETWVGCLLAEGGKVALLGTTVAPGFDFSDYTQGSRKSLLEKYPGQSELIIRLNPGQ